MGETKGRLKDVLNGPQQQTGPPISPNPPRYVNISSLLITLLMATHLFYIITNSFKQTNMKCVQFHLYLTFVFQFLHLILMVTLPYSNLFVFLLYHGTEESRLLLIKFVLHQIATFFFIQNETYWFPNFLFATLIFC